MRDKYKNLSTIIGAIDYQIDCWRKWLKEFIDLTYKTNEMAEGKIKELEESKVELMKWFNCFDAKTETYVVSGIEVNSSYGYPSNYFITFSIANTGGTTQCRVPINPEQAQNITNNDLIGVGVKVFKM